MTQTKEAKLLEKQKRKEVARFRTFWFLLVMNILLIGYLVIQVIILTGAK